MFDYISDNTPLDIIRKYSDAVWKFVNKENKMSFLDAEIVNRKLTSYLLGLEVKEETNFDLVEYVDEEDSEDLEVLFSLYEQYVIYDIYKLTGISLTEYRTLNAREKNVLLEYVFYKTDLLNLSMSDAEDELDKLQENNNQDFTDDLYRHSRF